MKKSNRTVRKMRSAWTGFTTACLAAALTMSALVSCAPQESRPVVTSDDLTPPSAAQEAIAQDIGGGKNYAYLWEAEQTETVVEEWIKTHEQIVDTLRGLIAQGEDTVKEAGFVSVEAAQTELEYWQAVLEREPEQLRQSLREEAALAPVVSAQEAANIAGVAFETMYGLDLSQKTLRLNCYQSDSNMEYHIAGGGVMRTVWGVELPEEPDGVLFSTNAAARWMRRPASLSPWIIRSAVKKSRPCRRRRFRPALSKGQTPTLRAAMAIGMKPKRAMPGQWRS